MATFQYVVSRFRMLKPIRAGRRDLCSQDAGKSSWLLASFPFLIVGILVGLLGWGSGPEVGRLAWVMLLPFAWGLAGGRWPASMLVVGYYLAGVRGLPIGSVVFFGDTAPGWWGWAFWVAACALLSTPFVLLWSAEQCARPWRFVLAVCLSAVPPLGIIGWVSPLAVAGVIFPGLGWAGVVLMLGAMAALAGRSGRWIMALMAVAVMANGVAFLSEVRAPAGWQGVDTHFSRLSSAGSDDALQLLATMKRVEWVRQFAEGVPAHSVRVLPETVLGSVDGMAELALHDTQATLMARGSRLLAGAELSQADGRYKNLVMVLGAKAGEQRMAVQNIPVPVSMWKPWAPDGAVANIFGMGNVIEVNGALAGVVVCYEQLLPYSLLWVMTSRPDVIVAVSNVWWARDTSIPDIQRQTTDAFGRLFGVAVVAAKNS